MENSAIKTKCDFIAYLECVNSLMNGDPDNANNQRMDVYTGKALMTDVCFKHKVRNYIDITKGGEDGYAIYIKNDASLNEKEAEAIDEYVVVDDSSNKKKGKKKEAADNEEGTDKKVIDFMCSKYYDVRAFGAVFTSFSSNKLTSRVNGPIAVEYGETVSPAYPQEISIIRSAVTSEEEKNEKNQQNTMGSKTYLPYGLFRIQGHIDAYKAEITGFSEKDLDVFFETVLNMFEFDRSAARAGCCTRKLIIFEHSKKAGDIGSQKLFDAVTETYDKESYPSKYSDYTINIDRSKIPDSVKVIELE